MTHYPWASLVKPSKHYWSSSTLATRILSFHHCHMRSFGTKTEPFLSRPLKVYALACTFGWAEDADKLSEQTLDLDLSSPYYAEVLKSIDSTFLYKLFQLRWGIKAEVVDGIRLTADMSYDDCYGCKPNCTSSETPAEEEWECLELLIRGELDRCPDGSSLRQSKFWSQVGLARLWNLRCNECGERAVRKSSVKERSLWRLDEAEPFTKK
ncbi:hypothetical protein BD410DRAFT_783734 [Rickenella mellea]|uniref:Uncharacterized protein n=1 Tax=Rickenella mellea TaxID=50990 RepID=A0A4Y7QID0_9AGAM|nr:hypothetical protein BD410DRAFT_783734 [Rickenella mellea]